MGRSLIPLSTIRRLAAMYNRAVKEQNKKNFINSYNSQIDEGKIREPKYYLDRVEFNLDTRISRLIFIQTQEYRTVQKYITQNYVKYPIYSEWKTKTKQIKKNIKLTNAELESLNTNEDF